MGHLLDDVTACLTPAVDVCFVHHTGGAVHFGDGLGGWRRLAHREHLIGSLCLWRDGKVDRHAVVEAVYITWGGGGEGTAMLDCSLFTRRRI